jgi:TonB family protein
MKTKKPIARNSKLNALSLLSFILLLIALLASCSASKKTIATPKVSADEPFVVVEEMPVFPGGDSTLLAYIVKNTQYPEKAKLNKTEGKVIIRFCVNKIGGVDRISVLKGVDPELDAEANRVVSTLPAFKPGRQGGKDVSVWYMVPIDFKLK